MDIQKFIKELRTRGVIKVASIYTVVMAGFVQVLTGTAIYMNIGNDVVKIIIYLVILFFPIALFLSWKFEVVPEESVVREKKTNESTEADQHKLPLKLKKLALLLLPLIAGLILLSFVTIKWLNSPANIYDHLRDEKIAVVAFINETGDPNLDYIGREAAQLISNTLSSSENINILSSTLQINTSLPEENLSKMGFGQEFYQHTGIKNLIVGSYFLDNDSLSFISEIVESSTQELIYPFEKQKGKIDDHNKIIESLCQHILGFWKAIDHKVFSENFPRADVSEEYIKATLLFEKDYVQAMYHLDKCINLDSTYMRAYLLKLDIFKYWGRFGQLDSLLQILDKKEIEMDDNERNLFHHYKAYSLGNNPRAFDLYMNELEINPQDPFVNARATLLAMNLVNRPRETIKIFKKINSDAIDMTKSKYYFDRSNAYITALIDVGRYTDALQIIENISDDPLDISIADLQIRAMARNGLNEQIKKIISEAKSIKYNMNDPHTYLNGTAAIEYALIGKHKLSEEYNRYLIDHLEKKNIFENNSTFLGNFEFGRALLLLKNYDLAESKYKALLDHQSSEWLPWEPYLIAKIGEAQGYQNKTKEALSAIQKIEDLKSDYDYGGTEYFKAYVWTSLGEYDEAIKSLNKSILEGRQFYQFRFQHDPSFIPLLALEEFKAILKR